MGQIHLGDDPQLERQVAVKVSTLAYGGEDPRFAKEAKVLAQLAHPNIVPIYTRGTDAQGRPFYSMKLIKGRTLQAVLNAIREGDAAAFREYPRAALLTIFRKVCDALAFAHSKRILHRDLKPENIMVGEYGEVLVMDWGLAKVLGEKDENVRTARAQDTGNYGMTLEGEVMGTPQYMSPEQAQGMVADLDVRSDIYSLGGILYAILTLRPPIEGKTLNEVLSKVKGGAISAMVQQRGGNTPVQAEGPAVMRRQIPEALRAVTLKAMALDREKRYASVEAFAADIESYQNGFATSAEDAGVLRQFGLFVKRNKTISSAAVLLLVAAAAFTVKIAASEKVARAHERQALEEKEKARRTAARAQLALAEAAESASDSVTLKRALADVPEDLRSRDWYYFESRIDTPNFSHVAPNGLGWVSLQDLPSDADRMLALCSDGQIYNVHISTGSLDLLWKFSPPGAKYCGPLAVSSDGKLAAIAHSVNFPGPALVDIFHIEDGSRLAQVHAPSRPSEIWVNGSFCAFRCDSKIYVWDHSPARFLWEAIGLHADFSEDQRSILIAATHPQSAQKRDLPSGSILQEAVSGVPNLHPNFPNSMGTKNWGRFFSPEFGRSKIRALNPWTGKVEFEISPQYGNYTSSLIPPGEFFAVLGRTSAEGLVVEIRSASTGMLSRSLPLMEGQSGGIASTRLKAKKGCLGLLSPRALRFWRVSQVKPVFQMTFSYDAAARRGDTSEYVKMTGDNDSTVMQMENVAEKDPAKRLLYRAANWSGKYRDCSVAMSADGGRWIAGRGNDFSAYQYGATGVHEVWASKQLPRTSFAIHPTEDRIWGGSAVYTFSSGQKMVDVAGRSKVQRASSPIWIGINRVAEILVEDVSGGSEWMQNMGEKVQIALWNTESGALLAKATAPNAEWLCVSPDGTHLAEAGRDKRVRIRNVQTLEVEREFRCHEDAVTGVAWHPRLPLLATASKDGCIRIWDVDDLRQVEELIVDPTTETIRLQIPPGGLDLNEVRKDRIQVIEPKCFSEAKGNSKRGR
jgi:tRNA A-37 threonylcarbamoyl transferase component Bud32